jgi:tRNA A-37 threonylcarbamoyl transferase component Bud32
LLRTDAVVADRYRLVDRIAEGGMGSVWEAWDERLHRTVALKRLHPQPELSSADAEAVRERAMREARITARLHHPNAVQVYDVVDVEGQPCLVMQYLPSRSLSVVIHERGALSPAEVARIGAEIGAALAAAHGVGIVHRDVKPGNVLIDESGSAKLTDFGISHALGDVTLTSTGMVTGTPAFLAPEVARGERSTPSSDVFSLGATLYAALEGQPPFGAGENPMATLHRVANGRMDPPRRSGPLTPLLLRMLALDPAHRPNIEPVVRELQGMRTRLERRGAAAAAGSDAAERTTRELDRQEPASRTRVLPPAVDGAGQGAQSAAPESSAPRAAAAAAAAPAAAAPTAGPPPAAPRSAPPPARPPAGRPADTPPPPEQDAPARSRRGRWWLVAALVAAVVLGGIIAAVALSGGNNPSPHAPVAGGKHSSTHTKPSASHSPSRHATHSTSHAAPPPATTPVTTPSHTPPTHSTSAPPAHGAPTAQQLSSAIIDYYQLLPGDTNDAWPRLTPSYQQGTAQGRGNYNSFWNQFSSVSASNVSASPPHTVVATITYTRKNGSTTVERTSFGLVRQSGELKINSSYVISSS